MGFRNEACLVADTSSIHSKFILVGVAEGFQEGERVMNGLRHEAGRRG